MDYEILDLNLQLSQRTLCKECKRPKEEEDQLRLLVEEKEDKIEKYLTNITDLKVRTKNMKNEIENLNFSLSQKGITDIQHRLREVKTLYETQMKTCNENHRDKGYFEA